MRCALGAGDLWAEAVRRLSAMEADRGRRMAEIEAVVQSVERHSDGRSPD